MDDGQKTKRRAKTSISVKEMGRLLGLKKVESYWLVQKEYFQTVTAGKVMRVMIDSFEDWYAKQFHYRKVTGEPPGQYYGDYMTTAEVATQLGINQNQAYNIVAYIEGLQRKIIDGTLVVTRDSFESWYDSQLRYSKVHGPPPGKAFEGTMSTREMSDLLGIPLRNTGYGLIDKGYFKSELICGQRRIDIESFETWYQNQSRYKKV